MAQETLVEALEYAELRQYPLEDDGDEYDISFANDDREHIDDNRWDY